MSSTPDMINHDSFLGAKRQTMRRRAGVCARPDCSITQRDTEEFVIERLVGRKTVGQAGYLFLVKWEGYALFLYQLTGFAA